jgi:hypothetical protein
MATVVDKLGISGVDGDTEFVKKYNELKKDTLSLYTTQELKNEPPKSFVISMRLPDSIIPELKQRAGNLTVGQYVKKFIENLAREDDTRPNAVNQVTQIDSQTAKSHNTILPIYDRLRHKAGDMVRIWKNGQLIEMVIPETDADGYVVNEEK